MSQLSVASTSAVQKKVQTAIAMAKQRLQTLDGTKEMAEGKLGVERHQAHLSVQSFDKDEIKKKFEGGLGLEGRLQSVCRGRETRARKHT